MVATVLTKEGAVVQSREMLYKAVVQTPLMYVSEISVVAGAMLTIIEGFHHQLAR